MSPEIPRLRLGLIGMSEGNGHPYSWSAIFNGYDPAVMAKCPFPAIPAYLAERSWPQDFLGDQAAVTHVWTQDRDLSEHIARASRISNVVQSSQDMLGDVDGVLLARDDCENHGRFAEPFLRAGYPVYVDKPLALSPDGARRLLSLQVWEGQLFTCSALRFAPELVPSPEAVASLGDLNAIEGWAPKSWEKYAVHVVEPAVVILARAGLLHVPVKEVIGDGNGNPRVTATLESGLRLAFTTTGERPSPIALEVTGSKTAQRFEFHDSFGAFRAALELFVRGVRDRAPLIDRDETLRVTEILSWGT